MLTRGLSFHVADSKWAFKGFWGLTGTQHLPIQHVQTHRNQPLKGFMGWSSPFILVDTLCSSCSPSAAVTSFLIPCLGQDLQG